MLRWSIVALSLIVAFGLLFALLPGGAAGRDLTGVRLQNVSLRLYPAQDSQAEWRFTAPSLAFDPVKDEATISGLQHGERLVRNAQSGALEQDLTIRTDQLTIDASDDIHTQQADIYLPKDCWAMGLRADSHQQVLIDQNQGISAPFADVHSANYNGQFTKVRVSFDLSNASLEQQPGATIDASPDVQCVGGQLVPKSRR